MKIILYKDPSSRVDWNKLVQFLSEEGFSVSLQEDFFFSLGEKALNPESGSGKEIPQQIAKLRVMGIMEPPERGLNPNPFQVEIDYESRNLQRKDRKVGPVYSGFHFQALLREIILEEGNKYLELLPILFTNQRLATWGEDRWHLRTVLLGFPSVISTTGLVEAPARERDYYLLKNVDPSLGEKWLEENPNHLVIDDPRLIEVVKGYLWQAVFYGFSLGRPESGRRHAPKGDFSFCGNPECSLYNSHWQREVLKAQYGGNLCKEHLRMKELKIGK
jgi:hypothetical protein